MPRSGSALSYGSLGYYDENSHFYWVTDWGGNAIGYRGNFLELLDDGRAQLQECITRVSANDELTAFAVKKYYFNSVHDGPAFETTESHQILPGQTKIIRVLADPGIYRLVLCRIIRMNTPTETNDDTTVYNRILPVNCGDHDGDGVPDFADSIKDQFSEYGHHPENQSGTPVGSFVDEVKLVATTECPDFPVTTVTGTVPWYHLKSAKVRFTYDASIPQQMSVKESGEGYDKVIRFDLPATGSLRLWKKNGSESRSAKSVADGGDFIPSGVWLPIELTIGGLDSRFPHVESVQPSRSIGDQVIKAEFDYDGDGTVDEISTEYFTSMSLGFWSVDPETGLAEEKLPAMRNSLPCPKLQITSFEVSNERPSSDGSKLLVDLKVVGTVRSAV